MSRILPHWAEDIVMGFLPVLAILWVWSLGGCVKIPTHEEVEARAKFQTAVTSLEEEQRKYLLLKDIKRIIHEELRAAQNDALRQAILRRYCDLLTKEEVTQAVRELAGEGSGS